MTTFPCGKGGILNANIDDLSGTYLTKQAHRLIISVSRILQSSDNVSMTVKPADEATNTIVGNLAANRRPGLSFRDCDVIH